MRACLNDVSSADRVAVGERRMRDPVKSVSADVMAIGEICWDRIVPGDFRHRSVKRRIEDGHHRNGGSHDRFRPSNSRKTGRIVQRG